MANLFDPLGETTPPAPPPASPNIFSNIFGPPPPPEPPPSETPAPPQSNIFAPTNPGGGPARPTTSGLSGLANSFYSGLSNATTEAGENIHVAIPVLKAQLGMGDPAELAAAAAPIRRQQAINSSTLAPELPTDLSNPSWWAQTAGGLIPGAIETGAAGPVGGTSGLIAGLFAAGPMTTNASSFFDYLDAHGVDTTNSADIQAKLLANPQLMADASNHAAVQSGISGLFNVLQMGTGRVIGSLAKGVTAEDVIRSGGLLSERPAWGRLRAYSTHAAAGGILMGTQTLTSEVAAGEPIDPEKIISSVALGGIGAAPEIILGNTRAFARRMADLVTARDEGRLPDEFAYNPTTRQTVPNPAYSSANDPEKLGAVEIMNAIRAVQREINASNAPKAKPGESVRFTHVPYEWRSRLIGKISPATLTSTNVGSQFWDRLDELPGTDHHDESSLFTSALAPAMVYWSEVPNQNANLQPTLRLTNPFAQALGASPHADLTISTGDTFSTMTANPSLIVDGVSRPLLRDEVDTLNRYAHSRNLDHITWRDDLLDAAFKGIKQVTSREVALPDGTREQVKSVRTSHIRRATQAWLPLSANRSYFADSINEPVPESIRSPAIYHEGRVYEGIDHSAALSAVSAATGRSFEDLLSAYDNDPTAFDGFTTSRGRFVDRAEAFRIASRAEQLSVRRTEFPGDLMSHEVTDERGRTLEPGEGFGGEHTVGAVGSRSPGLIYGLEEAGRKTGYHFKPWGDTSTAEGRAAAQRLRDATWTKLTAVAGNLARQMGLTKPIIFSDTALPRGQFGEAHESATHYHIDLDLNKSAGIGFLFHYLLHELGHVVMYDKFKTLSSEALLDILSDYQAFRQRAADAVTGSGSIDDLAKQLGFTRASAMEFLATRGVPPIKASTSILPDPADRAHAEYWHSFNEWFAQQKRRWVQSDARPFSVVEKHFSTLARFVLRQLSRLQRNITSAAHPLGLRFEPAPSVADIFNAALRDASPSAKVSLYERIANASMVANARSLKQIGALHVDPTTGQPTTEFGRGIVTELFKGRTDIPEWNRGERNYRGLAAITDRLSRFIDKIISLPQLAARNPDNAPLNRYNSTLQLAEGVKLHLLQAPTRVGRAFRRLSYSEQGKLLDAWRQMDRMAYRTQDEADNEVLRWPTPAERDAIKAPLSDEAKALFESFFTTINDSLDSWLNAQREVVGESRGTPPEKALRLTELDDLSARLKASPYVPHARFGKYTYTIIDKGTNTPVFFARYATVRERNAAVARYQANPMYPPGRLFDHRLGILMPDTDSLQGIPAAGLRFVLARMANQLSPSQIEFIKNMQYEQSPGRRQLLAWENRNDIPGYSTDFIRSYMDYFLHSTNMLARVRYRDQLQAQIQELTNQAATMDNSDVLGLIRNRMAQHFSEWIDPKPDAWRIKAAAYLIYLGYNVKSALIYTMQTPLQTYPFLASAFGDAAAIRQMTRTATNMSNYYRRGSLEGREEPVLRILDFLIKHGAISEAAAPEVAGMAEGRNFLETYAGNRTQAAWSWFLRNAPWMHQMVDQFNRRTAGASAAALALENPNAKMVINAAQSNPILTESLLNQGFSPLEARAAVFALHAIQMTQGVYARWARPPIFSGKKGALFIFKSFQQQFLFMLWNYPQAAVRSMLVMGFLGGLGGVPGYEEAKDLLKTLGWKLFGRDWDIEREARQFIVDTSNGTIPPDTLVHGLSRYGFGLPALVDAIGNTMHLGNVPFPTMDLSNYAGVGAISPVQTWPLFDPNGMQHPDEAIGKATEQSIGAAYSLGFSLYRVLDDPQNWRAWATLVPRAAWNLTRAWDALHDNVTTANGAHIIRFDPQDTREMAEALAMGLGYNTLRYEQSWDRLKAIQEVESMWQFRKEMLVRQFTDAVVRKNSADRARALNAIRQFNRTVPTGLSAQRIAPNELTSAATSRLKSNALLERGRSPQARNIGIVNEMNRLYPEGVGAGTRSGGGVPLGEISRSSAPGATLGPPAAP